MKQPVIVLAVTANFIVSCAALVVGGIALSRPARVDDAQMRAAVDANLAQREREAVEKLAPRLRGIYIDMLGDGPELDWPAEGPKTVLELVRPMVKIIEGMNGTK